MNEDSSAMRATFRKGEKVRIEEAYPIDDVYRTADPVRIEGAIKTQAPTETKM